MTAVPILLTAAQTLFMILPLVGLFVARGGQPTACHPPKLVIVVSAITAFALLIVMFCLDGDALGLALCAANLGLRLLEAARVAQLHGRSVRNARMYAVLQ
tara:strand:+ start:233 stop:535 length:303 start_codon:yes stop_codon:yes gene_type:complete